MIVQLFDVGQFSSCNVFNSMRNYNVFLFDTAIFFMQTFRVSPDLKFSLNHYFKQLNSIGGNLILKIK